MPSKTKKKTKFSPHPWGLSYLDIADRHTKYGHCFIYIHPEKKLWRINATAAEFYGNRGERYE